MHKIYALFYKNIIDVRNLCKKKKVQAFPFLGKTGGKVGKLTKNKILIPSNVTSRIQEMHIFVGQVLCEYIENSFS